MKTANELLTNPSNSLIGQPQNNSASIRNEMRTLPYLPSPDKVTDLISKLFPTTQSSPEDRLISILNNVIQQFVMLSENLLGLLTSKISELSRPVSPLSANLQNESAPQSIQQSESNTGSSAESSTRSISKSGQFLWKPKSDKDGRLAILLPPNISKDVKSVSIVDPDSKRVLETGKYSGIGNGERAHFRFKKAGGSYPDNIIVEITLKNGDKQRVKIPETSSRFTR